VGFGFPARRLHLAHSRKVIASDFAGVPEAVTGKIVFDNAAKLYSLQLG
jgi:hypothetical protein